MVRRTKSKPQHVLKLEEALGGAMARGEVPGSVVDDNGMWFAPPRNILAWVRQQVDLGLLEEPRMLKLWEAEAKKKFDN